MLSGSGVPVRAPRGARGWLTQPLSCPWPGLIPVAGRARSGSQIPVSWGAQAGRGGGERSWAELSCGRQEGGRDDAQAHGKRPSLSLAAGGCGVLRGVRQEQCLYSVARGRKAPWGCCEAFSKLDIPVTKKFWTVEESPNGRGKKSHKNQSNKTTTKKAKLCLNTLITKVFWHLFFL